MFAPYNCQSRFKKINFAKFKKPKKPVKIEQ